MVVEIEFLKSSKWGSRKLGGGRWYKLTITDKVSIMTLQGQVKSKKLILEKIFLTSKFHA